MSKFCMYCGRELADGETCNCHEKAVARGAGISHEYSSDVSSNDPASHTSTMDNQTSYTSAPGGATFYTAPPAPPKKHAFTKLCGRIWYYMCHFFSAPADTIAKAANQKDYGAGILFLVLSSIICSALSITVLNRGVSLINSVTGSILGAKYFTLNSFLQPFGLTIIRLFFSLIIFLLIANFLLCILSLATAKIAKSSTTLSSIVAAVGVSAIGTTCAFIVAIVLALLVPTLALPLGIGVMILSFSLTYIALIKSFKLSANKMAYLFAIIMIIMAAIFVIVYKLTPITVDFSNIFPSGTTMTPSSGNSFDSFFGNGF